jgi:hypothetical protein
MKRRKSANRAAVRRAPPPPGGEVIVYSAPDGTTSLEVRLDADTVWLNLNQMARLFGRDKSVISRHLSNVFKSRELERAATVALFAAVRQEGGRPVERAVEHFNLDAILSVGYRVNSKRGTQFRNSGGASRPEMAFRNSKLGRHPQAAQGLHGTRHPPA